MLVDGEGREVLDFGELEPWCYGVRVGDKVYPVLTIKYESQSVQITWAKEDQETIRKKWNREIFGDE